MEEKTEEEVCAVVEEEHILEERYYSWPSL